MQYFNIQVASQLSGVASATIRAWEKRYGAVVPERGDNKHRLYSDKDIEKLALLFKLTEFGQSIGKIAHLDLEELKKAYSSLLHRPYEELQVITPYHENIDFDKILNSFLIALSAYKLDIISHELDKAKNLLTPRELCLQLIVPLFHEISNRVARNELSIAQEHTLSAIFSFHIGQLIGSHYQKTNLKNDLILFATPEGELHEIGILASALLSVHYGIKFIYLGSNIPAKSLAEASHILNPRTIVLGTKNHADEYLQTLASELNGNTPIVVVGNSKMDKSELEKKRVHFIPSLQAFDDFLSRY